MEAVQASLAGDVAFLNMFPLSASEIDGRDLSPFRVDRNYLGSISRRRVQAPEIFEKIWGGGMPAVRGNRYAPSEYYAGYVQRCINRDVRDISGNIDPLKFMRFLTVTAGHCAELLNVKAIAEAAEIDQVTAKNWLTILASLGLIFYMHPFQHEVLHRTVKAPKLYFYDTGLVCWLTKWNSPGAAMSGAMAPQLFENFAVSEIIKGYCHHGAVPRIWYYRDRDSAEIDLVIEDEGELHPVEIRMTAKPTRRMTSSFVLLDREPLKRGLGAVITLNEKLSALTAETLVVPVSYL